jgi:DNA-binding NarL/FixJ family response regulator
MASSEKITILLADEDALRRDGLAALLEGTESFQIVVQCPDGETALDEIRELRPDVAVVDLNIPKLHGIELIRRVRAEAMGTKIVILAGTADDDIIREVVRAGGDAYLLKNGPARHLIDAISYVRDGGQYFSPQLRRDGLDRHLFEEPARTPPPRPARNRERDSEKPPARNEADDYSDEGYADDADEGYTADDRGERTETSRPAPRVTRPDKGRRSGDSRSADPQRFRERLRAGGQSENLEERDYEILSMMAEGIRPILDRLDEIEGRVGEMETGETPVPGNVRGWLDTQIADTFRGSRPSGKEVVAGRSIQELEARLPQLIEEAVTNRFHNMASKLQQEIEETHVKTLETFVKNIQVKLVQRVSALETDMSKQAEAMNELREYSLRTEDNLSRLISGVDKLARELPKRLAPPPDPTVSAAPEPEIKAKPIRRKSSRSLSPKNFWIAVAATILIVVAVVEMPKLLGRGKTSGSAASANAVPVGVPAPDAAPPIARSDAPAADADVKTKMLAAGQYADRKDYSMAEDVYKQVLKSEPNNVEAMKALASVYYREDKIDESAAILDRLPKN